MDFDIKDYKREVKYKKRFFEINGTEVDAYELYELLSELDGCDGAMSRMAIHDDNLADLLVDLDVIFKNARGSYGISDNYDEFFEKIEKIIFDETEMQPE